METHITNSFCKTVLKGQSLLVVHWISFRNVAPISDRTMYTGLLHVLTSVLNFMLPALHRRLSGDCFDITLSSLTSTAYCPKLLRQVICNNRTKKSAIKVSESFICLHASRNWTPTCQLHETGKAALLNWANRVWEGSHQDNTRWFKENCTLPKICYLVTGAPWWWKYVYNSCAKICKTNH